MGAALEALGLKRSVSTSSCDAYQSPRPSTSFLPLPQVLSLRAEKSKLLGFKNFAELSMASKVGPLEYAREGAGWYAYLLFVVGW